MLVHVKENKVSLMQSLSQMSPKYTTRRRTRTADLLKNNKLTKQAPFPENDGRTNENSSMFPLACQGCDLSYSFVN